VTARTPRRPARHRSGADRASRQAEAKALYTALREQAQDALVLAEQVRNRGDAHYRSHPYRDFQEKLSAFQALSALLRDRMAEVGTAWYARDAEEIARAARAQEEFDRLDLLMLSLYVRTSRRYFTLLSFADGVIPVGAVTWLRRDLPALAGTLERLRTHVQAGRLDPALEAELTTALLILNDLIGRLPDLPDFTGPTPAPG